MTYPNVKYKRGDVVTTTFSGKVTQHTITEVNPKASIACQSGVMVRVKPEVQGGGGADKWFDQGWFERVWGND